MKPFVNALLLLSLAAVQGCVVDRMGQSASETYRRELAVQATRTQALQATVDELTHRVDQIEEVTRARGQEEIMRMETLDQLRTEMARLRGDIEVVQHDLGLKSDAAGKFQEDTDYRLAWLETRAAALEKNLGLQPPSPPPKNGEEVASAATGGATGTSDQAGAQGGAPEEALPDEATLKSSTPDQLLALAESHMAAGRSKAARVVLERFIADNPKNERVAEANYRIGQSWFDDKEYQKAVLAFQVVLDKYKSSPWASWAMLRQGECFDAMGQHDNAQLFYDDVLRLFPKSKAAKEAKSKKDGKGK
jgi:tol-pal system protein YbgF